MLSRSSPSHPLAPHREEVRRRWRARRASSLLLRIGVIALLTAATASIAAPPTWWPWYPSWGPWSSVPGYMPITRSPRVFAGSVN